MRIILECFPDMRMNRRKCGFIRRSSVAPDDRAKCGERGIRTLDTFRYTRFPSVRTRPTMRSLRGLTFFQPLHFTIYEANSQSKQYAYHTQLRWRKGPVPHIAKRHIGGA